MTQTVEPAAPGIRHPDHSARWLVPPWPARAPVPELVRHFQRFQPAVDAASTLQAAYYARFAAVLAATPSGYLAGELSMQWFSELLSAVNQAALSAEAEQATADAAMLDAAQESLQFSLVRTLGLNSLPIEGQAL